MLNLSNDDRKQLRAAITSGFRNYASLKIFVSDNFPFRLNEIAPSNATREAAEALIEHFEEGSKDGDLSDLILALHQTRPNNPEVQKLMNRLQCFFQQRLLLDPHQEAADSLPFELSDRYNDRELESFLPRSFSYETDVGTLQRGLRLANGVCKISFTDRATTGTGVLVGPDLVLTNYHVLTKQMIQDKALLAEQAKPLLFEFGFVSEEHKTPRSPDTFEIATAHPIVSYSPIAQLDYVLLRVEPKIKRFDYIQPVSISAQPPSLVPKDGLNVLQHPAGNVMQASLSASGVVEVHTEQARVWYVNRTQGGSSGSPCFNSNWEMVALHHASMSRGFGSIREGILFSSILAEISDFLR